MIIATGVVITTCAGCREIGNVYTGSTATLGRQRQTISLAGQWRFQLDPENIGEKENWYDGKLTDRIKLPGSTAENGFGDDISVDTKWTGRIIDRSWFTDEKYEKYRQPGNIKIPFWLTPVKHYVGPAWYQRQVDVPRNWQGRRITLFLERCHWETKVWVDGVAAGMQDSLCTPHIYDLSELMTPGKHLLAIRVDNAMKYNVGVNAHSVSDNTKSNWNGIVGRMELQTTDTVWISDIQVYPDIENGIAKVRITVRNTTGQRVAGTINTTVLPYSQELYFGGFPIRTKTVEFAVSGPTELTEVDFPMDSGTLLLLWDEFKGATYGARVQLKFTANDQTFYDIKTVTFGMREFGTKGTQFTINNRPTFLRGTLECSIFPLTGYPDMSVEGWLRIIRIAKAHGLNHMRFHSWCPPEAAFEAADRMGFMLHVECPAWATIGNGKPIDKFIYAEGDRILKAYGNHPSFCMLAYGNEPGGANQKRYLGDLVNHWKQKDPRRIYTSAAGWPIIPENDYHSTPAPRGHQWGSGLKSRFNANPPETITDYSSIIQNYDAPVVSHEIGQWCVYPNFREIKKYTGVLRALNFEIFRDSLADHHMLDQAHDFLIASGKLQALLYKEEIESALRTPGFGGFQLLDIHDFPGQGTALVGILDPFWDSKGYIEPQGHHRFCCETVPLVRMEKRIWTTAETFSADVEIAHFGPAPIKNATALWSISYADGHKFASGQLPSTTIQIGNGIELGNIEVPLDEVAAPAKLTVTVTLKGTGFSNSWDIWVYPDRLDTEPPENILIADSLDEQVETALKAGGKVLLMPPLNTIDSDIPAGFTSIFWNTQWTRRQPAHFRRSMQPEAPGPVKIPHRIPQQLAVVGPGDKIQVYGP